MVVDDTWRKHLAIGEILEDKTENGYRTVFIRLTEEQQRDEMMQYFYRAIWFPEGSNEPVLVFNLEKSFAGYFLGAFTRDAHLNFGPAQPGMSFEEFEVKALELSKGLL
jgi:hypothetical protein